MVRIFGRVIWPLLLLARPRISQFYLILSDFLAPEIGRFATPLYLFFQNQTPVNIVKTSFDPVSTGPTKEQSGFILSTQSTLSSSAQSTALLLLSCILPVLSATVVVVAAVFVIVDKIADYRKSIFLSTVEGERLSRLVDFADLAQVPFALKTHVSELVKSAPASAHLQSKFKADLLKIMSLFEIQERKPMPEYSCWYTKVRQTPFTLKNTILISLRQLFSLSSAENEYEQVPTSDDPNLQSEPLKSAGVQESFKTYLFKNVHKKFVRKVSFSSTALEQSFKEYLSEPTTSETKNEVLNQLNQFKSEKHIDFVLHQIKATVVDDGGDDKKKVFSCVFEAEDDTSEMKSRIHDYVIVKCQGFPQGFPFDPRFGYCIRNVKEVIVKEVRKKTFDLISLDNFQILEMPPSFVGAPFEVNLTFEDPYTLDDQFLQYAFNEDAFEHAKLVSSFNRIYNETFVSFKSKSRSSPGFFANCFQCCDKSAMDNDESKKRLATESSYSGSHGSDSAVEMNSVDKSSKQGACIFGAPVFRSNETLKWNPFRDRIILATTAIFFESVESFRQICSSTGVESFFDLLIVNGSKNLKKWKSLGSIDYIMNKFHRKKAFNKDSQESQDTERNVRIPAFFEGTEDSHKKVVWKLHCQKKNIEDHFKPDDKFPRLDFSLHGPAVSSKDAVQFDTMSPFEKIKVSVDQKTFRENIAWQPFQPGCIFHMEWPSSLKTIHGTPSGSNKSQGEESPNTVTSFIVSDGTRTVPEIEFQFDPVESVEVQNGGTNPDKAEKADKKLYQKCHMHMQCFHALQQRVEEIESAEDEDGPDGSNADLYAHQFLDAYKPKGKNAIISPFLHGFISIATIVPTFAFFGFWAYNQSIYYSMPVFWSLAIYFLIICAIYIGIAVIYFFLCYLEFPYLFYGKRPHSTQTFAGSSHSIR
jgi:hypothetical protein